MNYADTIAGRLAAEASNGGRLWTFDDIQTWLIEAMRLWRRSPGGGKWPFAGDGPWHLVRKELFIDHDAGREPAKARPLPLSRADIALRDRVSEWLRFVPDRDRRLVVLALVQLERGRSQVRWSEIRRQIGAEVQGQSLAKRYSRALTAIARGLNSADFRAVGVSSRLATS